MSNDYQGGYDPNQNQSGYGQGGYGGGASPYPSSQPSSTNPASQSSASYGASNSWGDPVGQRSAGYVEEVHGQGGQGGQWAPQGDQQMNQGGEMAGQYGQGQYGQGQYGQGQGDQYAAAQTGQAAAPDDNFFKALVDFNFTRYATPSVIKIFYILGLILGAVYWLGGALMMLVAGSLASSTYSSSSDGGGVIAGFLWFLLGAPVYFFYIVALRVQLEYMLAMVRTNQDTKAIRSKLDA